ncbi:MAG: hypothetical protein JWR11_5995 [Mycobacterium sp.]|jgi:hypothetical protein|nr:hypothetical protein [Mycobacterium sp.]MDT5176281.1 hypothetical protein [Mycobacterium sp.]
MTNSIARTLTRYLALPLVAAGIGGAAVLGSASIATAAPSISANDNGNFFSPSTKATPPVLVYPGARWHRQHSPFDWNFAD